MSVCKFFTRSISLLFVILAISTSAFGDPWSALQSEYKSSDRANNTNKDVQPPKFALLNPSPTSLDPWSRLQSIFMPFTEKDEIAAITDKKIAKKVSHHLHKALKPFETTIKKAADLFNIPPEVIGAVIMVESGGDPNAKAKTSTASGLMQTIRSTFQEARQGLVNMGYKIKNTPFDPKSSIMAGSWYLSQMFDRAKADGKSGVTSRDNISSWDIPSEYYYAGPGNGKKDEEKVIIYSGGKRIVVDKPAYSQKVMRWAEIMRG